MTILLASLKSDYLMRIAGIARRAGAAESACEAVAQIATRTRGRPVGPPRVRDAALRQQNPTSPRRRAPSAFPPSPTPADARPPSTPAWEHQTRQRVCAVETLRS